MELLAVLGLVAAVTLTFTIWALMSLPRVSLAPNGGLVVSNRGLPLANAVATAKNRDGGSTTFTLGAVARGTQPLVLPPDVRPESLQALTIDGELLGLRVTSYTLLDDR